jgi:hypothetical protein
VGRTEVGVSVVAPVDVAEGVGEGVSSVSVVVTAVEGGSVEVVLVSMLVVVGVGLY